MAAHELLDKVNMQKVIKLLNQDKPITKKAACEILNITYNTTRLGKLINEFTKREESIKKARAKLRGKPLSTQELQIIAQEYLNGTPVTEISESTFRPTSLINKAVRDLNIPLRTSEASYLNPSFIEDAAINEHYEPNDLVYAARYQCPALIERKKAHKEGAVYTIYLLGKEQCYATQPYWELADLRKISAELGISIKAQPGLPPANNPR